MPLRRSCLNCTTQGPHCFCSLDRVALQRMDGLGTWLRVAAGERVLIEGDASDRVYVICRGTMKLSTSSQDGRLLILRIVGPGDVLGLAAALERNPYEATAETIDECEIKSIPRTQFLLFLEEFQAVSRNSVLAVARAYQSAVVSARRLALAQNASAKLAGVLVEWGGLVLASNHGEDEHPIANEVRFRMPLTHEELGHMAGISRETVTRVLSAFRKENLVRVEADLMVVPDLRRLQQQAH